DALLAEEALLVRVADLRVETRVVGQSGHPTVVQPGCDGLHALAGHAVDDPRVAVVLCGDEAQQLFARTVLRIDPVLDVRPVEAGDEVLRLPHPQARADLAVRLTRRGRREGDARDVRERV